MSDATAGAGASGGAKLELQKREDLPLTQPTRNLLYAVASVPEAVHEHSFQLSQQPQALAEIDKLMELWKAVSDTAHQINDLKKDVHFNTHVPRHDPVVLHTAHKSSGQSHFSCLCLYDGVRAYY